MSHDEFTKLDAKIDKLASDLSEQMLKLYQHFDDRCNAIEGKLDQKADGARIYAALDAIAKNQEVEQHERLAMIQQLDRHEGWIHQLADTTGAKLRYEQ